MVWMTLSPLQGLSETLRGLMRPGMRDADPGRLTPVELAANPGGLAMWEYRPADLPRGAPLVVALHGCGQSPAGLDLGTGWSVLADRLGFALLFPEQQAANNAQTCFNWFEPGDIARGAGEAASIATAVEDAVRRGGLDRHRVFVTGLSAGAAMAGVMLACYPELFAAGALIAGLPFGVASDVRGALDAMFRPHPAPGSALGERVRAAGPRGFAGPWPRVSVWHGTADTTVKSANAVESVKQWLDVHGLTGAGRTEPGPGASRTAWRDRAGRTCVEQVMVPGLGHGVPIAPAGSGIGVPGPFILSSSVSSTEEIARFFGLLPYTAVQHTSVQPGPEPSSAVSPLARLLRAKLDPLRLLSRPLGRP